MEGIGQGLTKGLGQGLASIVVIALYISIAFFLIAFLIGFWLSGKFTKNIKNKISRFLIRVFFGVICAGLVVFIVINIPFT